MPDKIVVEHLADIRQRFFQICLGICINEGMHLMAMV